MQKPIQELKAQYTKRMNDQERRDMNAWYLGTLDALTALELGQVTHAPNRPADFLYVATYENGRYTAAWKVAEELLRVKQ